MQIDLSLNLDTEQTAALQKRADEAGLSPQAYLLRSHNAEIASYVEADFNAASRRLIDAAKFLPFEQRLAIIAQVENALTQA